MYSYRHGVRGNFLAFAFCLLLSAACAHEATAQPVQVPYVSPHAVSQQRVGMSDITIDYYRPSVNGREIWGALVPWGETPFPWRAGANDNTTITFSHDVKIDGKALKAGTYGLHMAPTETSWTIIFSNNSTSWGSFSYDKSEDALRIQVTPKEAPFREQLVYGFDNVNDESAWVYMHWEKVMVGFTAEFNTEPIVMQSLSNQLRHTSGWTWQGWQQAAAFAISKGYDNEQALAWVERSIQLQRNFNNLSTKSLLLNRMGKSAEAAEFEKEALKQANEAQVNAFGYAAMASGDVDKAIDVFKLNVERHPESWNVYDSLAEAYAQKGESSKAIELYKKALSMAPEAQHPRINGLLKQLNSAKS